MFDLDPLGSILEDNYVASGISTEVAYGILESGYKEDLPFQKAKNLVLQAFKAASRRDVLVGNYADIAYILKRKTKIEHKLETVDLR